MANPTTLASRRKKTSPIPMARVLVPVVLGVIGMFALGHFYGDSRASQPTAAWMAEIGARAGAADGSVLFADGSGIRELRLSDGKKYPVLLRAPNGRPMRSPALSPDGRTLAFVEEAGALEAAVMQRDLSAPNAMAAEVFRAAAVGPIGFSPSGRAYAFAAREGAPGTGGSIVVVEDGKPRTLAAGRAEVGPATAMPPSFSADGSLLAFTGREGTIEVVDPATGAPTQHFAGADPAFAGAAALGFEWDGLRFRTAFPPEVAGKERTVAAREFEHAISRERRRSPLAYSPGGELAFFVRATGAHHTFPPGAGREDVQELCILDVATARIVVVDSDFDPAGAISFATAKP